MKLLKWYWHNIMHKFWVVKEIIIFCSKLLWRGIVHDLSKLSKIETKFYKNALPELKGLTYGTKEYYNKVEEIKPAIVHHYRNNSHHPEYYKDKIEGMSLLDIVEMLCDWKASVKKHADGNLDKSLKINKQRFNISKDLYSILRNSL